MQTADLRQRLTVQAATETSDGHGGYTAAWADVVPTRRAACIEALLGRDLEQARAIVPLASHRVTLRWFRDYVTALVGGRAQLIWHDGVVGDRTLEVVEAPRETEPRVWLQMICRESR